MGSYAEILKFCGIIRFQKFQNQNVVWDILNNFDFLTPSTPQTPFHKFWVILDSLDTF